MRLYSMQGTCALSVHIMLEWIGAAYDLVLMEHGQNRDPTYLAINPSGKVPAVVTDDGQVLTQAAAILSWLTDDPRQAGSANSLERFRLDEMLSYLTSEVHVAFGPFFAPSRYLDDEAEFENLQAKSLSQVSGHLAGLDIELEGRTYLLGERSAADAYLYVLTRWADNLQHGLRPYPHLGRFRRLMEQDQAVARALEAQGMKPLG